MPSIPVSRPSADAQTIKELTEVIKSGWWGWGKKVLEFEEKFAKKVGAKYCISCNSGTSALDLCLKAHDIQGGELITTPMTFVSSAIVGEFNGMDVTFADIKEDDLCIDPKSIWLTPQTKAIIAVDSHGRLADIETIKSKFDGLVIEDAAHACYTPGAGKYADMTIWSFQAVKTLPAGDGGAITTNDEAIYHKLRALQWLGVEKHTYQRVTKTGYAWDYDIHHSGIKAYMNDITAVIALGNLRRLDKTLEHRRNIQEFYNLNLPEECIRPKYSHTVQYYTMRCPDRDGLFQFLAENGISTSVHFKPLHIFTYWRKAMKRPLPVADKVWTELLSLPVYNDLTLKDLKYIVGKVKEFYASN